MTTHPKVISFHCCLHNHVVTHFSNSSAATVALSRKDSDSAPLPHADALAVPARTPPAMPVPSVPRRAAPPRRKTPKTPSLPPEEDTPTHVTHEPSDSPDSSVQSPGSANDTHPAEDTPGAYPDSNATQLGLVHVSVPDEPLEAALGTTAAPVPVPVVPQQPASPVPLTHEPSDVPTSLHSAEEDILHIVSRDRTNDHPTQPLVEDHEEGLDSDEKEDVAPHAPVTPPGDEADMEAEARRRRVAERLAKMGAFNPFAPPARRQSSRISDEEPGDPITKSVANSPTSPVEVDAEDKAEAAVAAVSSLRDDDEGSEVEEEIASPEIGNDGIEAEREELEEEEDGKC